MPPDAHFLQPTVSSQNKQSRSRLSSASSQRSVRSHRGHDSQAVTRLLSQVQDCQFELKNLLHKQQAQNKLIASLDTRCGRQETRTGDLEIKALEGSQQTHHHGKEVNRLARELGDL